MKYPVSILAVALLLAWSATAQPNTLAERELARSLDALLDDEPFENAFWGAIVMDAHSGIVIYERNPDKSFIPASNAKLYSTAAALQVLGPSFSYQTDLFAKGTVAGGVLEGHLVIRGSGDPTFGGRFHDDDRLHIFRTWADSLRRMGVGRIEGDIIGDPRIFDDAPLGRGWNWDDEPYWYSAEISGLSYNDNTIDVTVTARSQGQPAIVTWEPAGTGFVRMQNWTTTISRDSSVVNRYSRDRGTNHIVFESRMPEGSRVSPSVSITDPARYAAFVFMEELRRQGIEVTGTARSVSRRDAPIDYASGTTVRVARYTSVPLSEIVDVINKRSHNLWSEQLLKTVGALAPVDESLAHTGSAAMGIERSRRVWGTAGVDTSRIRLVDGSGLSRHNLVTPRMTASLLSYMWNHPDEPIRRAFIESLPVGGIDGTLSARLRAAGTRGNVRAKTGTLSGASALAGYVTTRRGQDLIFVMMANHYTTTAGTARGAQDRFLERLVAW
jgi:serine-type D-Ala-D-Ala carboxypeptidase/endopeptidase (penicillin-binding protein 4)